MWVCLSAAYKALCLYALNEEPHGTARAVVCPRIGHFSFWVWFLGREICRCWVKSRFQFKSKWVLSFTQWFHILYALSFVNTPLEEHFPSVVRRPDWMRESNGAARCLSRRVKCSLIRTVFNSWDRIWHATSHYGMYDNGSGMCVCVCVCLSGSWVILSTNVSHQHSVRKHGRAGNCAVRAHSDFLQECLFTQPIQWI